MNKKFRIEKDMLGEYKVPEEVYWGINTQRALDNFQISGKTFPPSFLQALAKVKKACILSNMQLNLIEEKEGKAIIQACDEIISENRFLDQFPIDIFQTGSGTQTNMNMNEVLANRANEILGYSKGLKHPIHPNDHVNRSQSSNDVIPTAMHIVVIELIKSKLNPAVSNLLQVLEKKISEFKDVIKVGRTHLMDAVPIPLSLEFSVYHKQIKDSFRNIRTTTKELYDVPLGGTALGTGLGAKKEFPEIVIKHLKTTTNLELRPNPIKAEGIASHLKIVSLSSTLKILGLALSKMANDIRLMGSGPRAGFGELILPKNEPGSSIMPGKVNPTQSEMLIQVCLQVLGNDTTITFSEIQGSILDLNVTKPILIMNIIESIELLSKGIESFVDHCLVDLKPNFKTIKELNEKNLMIITKIASKIGYDLASSLANEAYETQKNLKDLLKEKSELSEKEIEDILNPKSMI